jgi:hypothetical protein
VGAMPWLAAAKVLYSGHLDTRGFSILDRLHACLPQSQSLLMDRETLLAHGDRSPRPHRPPRVRTNVSCVGGFTALSSCSGLMPMTSTDIIRGAELGCRRPLCVRAFWIGSGRMHGRARTVSATLHLRARMVFLAADLPFSRCLVFGAHALPSRSGLVSLGAKCVNDAPATVSA